MCLTYFFIIHIIILQLTDKGKLMSKVYLCITLCVLCTLLFCACDNNRGVEDSEKKEVIVNRKVCFIYDSQNPTLMQPDSEDVGNILKQYNVDLKVIDLATRI